MIMGEVAREVLQATNNQVAVIVDVPDHSFAPDARQSVMEVLPLTREQFMSDDNLKELATPLKELEIEGSGLNMLDVFFEAVGGNPSLLKDVVSPPPRNPPPNPLLTCPSTSFMIVSAARSRPWGTQRGP